MDRYIHFLRNFCDDNLVEEEELTSISSVDVNKSFSVAVGKAMSSHECMGKICDSLNSR